MASPSNVERKLLCACAQRENAAAVQAVLLEAAQRLDWEVVVRTAYAHGITGLLCHNLLLVEPALVPGDIRDAALAHLRQCADTNRRGTAQMSLVLTALAGAGIRAVPFKGPSLATWAYGDTRLRSFRDLDFLVRAADADATIRVLEGLGFRQRQKLSGRQWREFVRYSGQDILHGPGLPIEPHWALAPRTMAFDFDHEELLARAVRDLMEGQPVWRFAPEDELLVLCAHGAKEQWPKLKWVADVAAFARRHPTLDWDTVIHRASAQGFARIVRIALRLAERLCSLKLPEHIGQWARSDARGLGLADAIAERFFDARPVQPTLYRLARFHWTSRERWRERARYAWRTVTQPRTQHFETLSLPDRLFVLYWPLKLVHDYVALPLWLAVKRLRARHAKVVVDETG